MTGRRTFLVVALLGALCLAGASARATAPPVGPLPKGPVTSVRVPRGQLFALVVPRPGPGLSWRGAGHSDPTVARPLDEAEVNGNVVFVYRAVRVGRTTVVYALTRDEQPAVRKARYFAITVF